MAHGFRGFTAILPFAVLLIATGTHAEDWPAWTGPLGRNVSGETGLPDSFDRNDLINVKWATKVGTVAFGCPTVANGKIFIGTNHPAAKDDPRFDRTNGGVLTCLDETVALGLLAKPGMPPYNRGRVVHADHGRENQHSDARAFLPL